MAKLSVRSSIFTHTTTVLTLTAGIPSQSIITTTAPYNALSSVSVSYTYTVTTPTTIWTAPTFPTASPLPPCVNAVCPSNHQGRCVDSEGIEYGVLCNTLFSGIVITNAGKFMGMEKRSYTGTFEGCTAFCDVYNKTLCVGVTFEDGDCLAYDVVTGTFPNRAGGFAALRLS